MCVCAFAGELARTFCVAYFSLGLVVSFQDTALQCRFRGVSGTSGGSWVAY